MAFIISFLQNIGPWVAAVNGVLGALIALFLLVPGEQPEKALKGIADLLAKFSAK